MSTGVHGQDKTEVKILLLLIEFGGFFAQRLNDPLIFVSRSHTADDNFIG